MYEKEMTIGKCQSFEEFEAPQENG